MGKQGSVITFSLETIKRMNWKYLVEYERLMAKCKMVLYRKVEGFSGSLRLIMALLKIIIFSCSLVEDD
jgi:hypothetical protein